MISGKECPGCGRIVYGTDHKCPEPPKEYKDPPSTAESDYKGLYDDLSKRTNDRDSEL